MKQIETRVMIRNETSMHQTTFSSWLPDDYFPRVISYDCDIFFQLDFQNFLQHIVTHLQFYIQYIIQYNLLIWTRQVC